MAANQIKDLTYTNRPKAKLDNATDFGTRPAAPEGAGSVFYAPTTRILSLPSSDTLTWVDYKVSFVKDDATTSPTTGDDSDDGYHVGSLWLDVTADEAFICVDASVGAAVWVQLGVGGAVDSVFGRTGAVVAVSGDYGSDEITNDSTVTGSTVSDALEQLDSDIGAIGGSGFPFKAWAQATNGVDDLSNTVKTFTNEFIVDTDYLDTGTDNEKFKVADDTKDYIFEIEAHIYASISDTWEVSIKRYSSADSLENTNTFSFQTRSESSLQQACIATLRVPTSVITSGDYFKVETRAYHPNVEESYLIVKYYEVDAV